MTALGQPRQHRLGPLALALVATPGAAAWAGLVHGFGPRAIPVLAAAVALAAAPRPEKPAALALLAWLAAAPVAAGAPDLSPAHALAGARALALVSTAPVGRDPWALATALLISGAAWLAASALSGAPGFGTAVLPWAAAIALGPPSAALWQGGLVAAGAVLWFAALRLHAVAALAAAAAVALTSSAAAQVLGTNARWFKLPGSLDHSKPPFRSLSTEPSYGPLGDRRGGATMLEVTADAPMLWRVQALDDFDGVTWRAARTEPPLPQPAAVATTIGVRVRGLRDDLIVSPGRVQAVIGPGAPRAADGEAWSLKPMPRAGARYLVEATVIRPDPAALRQARPPTDPRMLAYTSIPSGRPALLPLPGFSLPLPLPLAIEVATPPWGGRPSARARAAAKASPYADVAALARRIAAGARSEYDVVERVQRFLLDGDRFRYTTDVALPGPRPLADFLLKTHAGYCQHFAGAAALLLRLAGVPARVVAGFATGLRRGDHYDVRDVDAHDWIEVYFTGVGWVPFNPTPAAAPAAIPAAFGGAAAGEGRGVNLLPVALIAASAVVALVAVRRRRDPAERLAALVGAGPQATLRVLRAELSRRVGPNTAALAAAIERARFGRPAGDDAARARRLASALARDVGPLRAARALIRSAR